MIVIVCCLALGKHRLVYWRCVIFVSLADTVLCADMVFSASCLDNSLQLAAASLTATDSYETWSCDIVGKILSQQYHSCNPQGFVNNSCYKASILWTLALAITLLWITTKLSV